MGEDEFKLHCKFCKERHIDYNQLQDHQYVDDLEFLLIFRNILWNQLTEHEHKCWGLLWDMVFHNNHELKDRHFAKLETILIDVHQRQIAQIKKQTRLSSQLKQLQSSKTAK